MNQTTVDSNNNIQKYTEATNTIYSFYLTENSLEVPPPKSEKEKAFTSFTGTYSEGMEISVGGNCEFDEKTGEIIEDNGTILKVSEKEMKIYNEGKPVRNLIAKIKEALKNLKESLKEETKKEVSKPSRLNTEIGR